VSTRPVPEDFMPAALAGLPRPVRDAITAVVDYNWSDEERDYLGNCGNGPGDNARAGHVFEHLTLLRRWLEGNADGLHVDTCVWVADPGRPGCLRAARRKTVAEVHRELVALAGRREDGITVVDGADEYFSVSLGVAGDREWPEGRIAVFAVTGGSEGHDVHVEVKASDGHAELMILGKGFAGPAAARALARRLAGILGA
jgi:hypothetical protein